MGHEHPAVFRRRRLGLPGRDGEQDEGGGQGDGEERV
jgi:hypothetical protein